MVIGLLKFLFQVCLIILIAVMSLVSAGCELNRTNFSQYPGFEEYFRKNPPSDKLPSPADQELLRRYRPRFIMAKGQKRPIDFYQDYIAHGVLINGDGREISRHVDQKLLNKYRHDPNAVFRHMPDGTTHLPVVYGRISRARLRFTSGEETTERLFTFLGYHLVFESSGLSAGIPSWADWLLGLFFDLSDWHQLDHYTAAFIVLDGDGSGNAVPVALMLQQHDNLRTYLIGEGITLPEDGRLLIDAAIRSNELYPHTPGRTYHRAVYMPDPGSMYFLMTGRKKPFFGGYDITDNSVDIAYDLHFLPPDDAFYSFRGFLGERRWLKGRDAPPGADYNTLPELKPLDMQLFFGYWRENHAGDIGRLQETIMKHADYRGFASLQGIEFFRSLRQTSAYQPGQAGGSVNSPESGHGITITLKGDYRPAEDHLTLKLLQAGANLMNPCSIRGAMDKLRTGNPRMDLHISCDGIRWQEILRFIPDSFLMKFPLAVSDASASANLVMKGFLRSPEVKGEISLRGDTIKFHDKDFSSELRGAALVIPSLEFSSHSLRADAIKFTAGSAAVSVKGKGSLSDRNIALEAGIDGDLDHSRFTLSNLSFRSEFIKEINGNISLTAGGKVMADVLLDWHQINLAALQEKMPAGIMHEGGYHVHGNGDLHAELKISPPDSGSALRGTARIRLSDAGFSSPDGRIIAEGISLRSDGHFELPPSFKWISFSARTGATGFELLAGKFYGNFTDKRLAVSLQARYVKEDDALYDIRAEADLSDTLKAALSGDLRHVTDDQSFDGRADLLLSSNKIAYDFFIRETFREQFPLLSRLEISGSTEARFSVTGSPDGLHARGKVRMTGTDVTEQGTERFIHGLNLDLPFDVSFPETPAPHDTNISRFGSLRMQDVSWAALSLSDIEVFPVLWQNELAFEKDIDLPMYGGKIEIRDITYRHLLSPQRALRFTMNIRDIDLAAASAAMDIPRFGGNLSGAIPRVSFSEGRLVADGEVVLHAFDGSARLTGLSADNLFTPVMSLRSDIDMEDINLARLTDTFDFGHISGILEGAVRDLVIVRGQPQRFTASVSTVKRRGISQKISVEALRKISILGSGSSASILDRGIYQFFKEYRYDMIGFTASLKNDTLLLRGLESRGNVGYLVKGGILPPKVNVMNYNQNISFKELVRRLKRIKQAE